MVTQEKVLGATRQNETVSPPHTHQPSARDDSLHWRSSSALFLEVFFFLFTSHSPQSQSGTTASRILTIYQSQNDLCVLQYLQKAIKHWEKLQRACIKPGLNSRQWHLSATFFTCSPIPLVVISHSPTAKSAHSFLSLSFSHFQMKRR